MAANSIPPSIPPSAPPSATPPSGGNGKLIVIALLLLLGLGGVGFFLFKGDDAPPPTPTQPPAPIQNAQPAAPSAADDIVIPDELPDAAPAPTNEPPRKRIVYVDGPGGNWDCGGNIDPAKIRSAVAEHSSEVRSCYERRLKVNNTLQGNVRITVKVGANGSVAATQVGGSLRDNEVFSCIRGMAERWHFPNPEGGSCAVVQIPYNMTPNR